MKILSRREIIQEIHRRIGEINNGSDADHNIPVSDTIHRDLLADLVVDRKQSHDYLHLLQQSHFIFYITIIEGDESRAIESLDGFVVADIPVIQKLEQEHGRRLERLYEVEKHERKGASTIMRELVIESHRYKNTPIGKALNVAVMLSQFAHLMEERFAEYTDEWRESTLAELLGEAPRERAEEMEQSSDLLVGSENGNSVIADAGSHAGRAIDQVDPATIDQIDEMDRSGQWGEAVDNFGVEFLLRIHFRRYEFDRVRQLVQTKRITKERDLRFIRDTMRDLENRAESSPALKSKKREIVELRRAAQLKINQIFQARKALTDGQ